MSRTYQFKIIAIDGGAATGKSSTARALAERLNLMHVDTGAHYRTLTCALINADVDLIVPEAIEPVLQSLQLGTVIKQRSAYLSINGQRFNDAAIRSPEVNANVSRIASIESVRTFLFNYQRNQAQVAREQGNFGGIVMEGRDIGSVIFPDADFRFFLFADEATRITRRLKEGQKDSVTERDKQDSERKTAPMICPKGAIKIDTNLLTLEGVVDQISEIIRNASPNSSDETT